MSPVLEKIRAIRSKKGFSQDYLAQKLDVDVSTYGKVERGIIELTVDRLEKIATEFEMSVADIYAYNPKSSIAVVNEEFEGYNITGADYEVSVTIKINNPNKEREILRMIGLNK